MYIHTYIHTYRHTYISNTYTGGTCRPDSITLVHLSWGLDIEDDRVVLACGCHTVHDTGEVRRGV